MSVKWWQMLQRQSKKVMGLLLFLWETKEGLTDKMKFERDLKDVRHDLCESVGIQSQKQEQPVQRPCGQSNS